jgi:uncharacterized membrane protein
MNDQLYPRPRLDALTDAVFGVAMTLLVLDVRLPEEFHPQNGTELLRGIAELMPKFLPYVISFIVLGLRWLSTIQVRTHSEAFGRKYAMWWLLYLLLITCVPFTTIVVGRFANLAPAIWMYAGNTILISAVAFRLFTLSEFEPGEHARDRIASLVTLVLSSVLAIGWSFVNPRQALLAYVLNAAAPMLARSRQLR